LFTCSQEYTSLGGSGKGVSSLLDNLAGIGIGAQTRVLSTDSLQSGAGQTPLRHSHRRRLGRGKERGRYREREREREERR
jgi:hypothetical protein